ncbi:MAG TPA: hypothetical protein VKI65_19140 [Gemmataceae bacterium]|nr:hypothetical protein [Gemmataceae bacterium]
MRKWLAMVVVVAFAGLTLAGAGEDKPKYTISEVMKEAHKSGLYKKVAEGKADQDEKEKLVDLYTSLPKNEPPKGDKKEWKKQTEAMLKAAKGALKDDKTEAKKLLKLVNCKTCHGKFRED